jgi:hypothetical protein
MELCQKAMGIYESMLLRIKEGGMSFNTETWHFLLRVLIGICDRLLAPVEGDVDNKMGDDLALQLIHLVIGSFLGTVPTPLPHFH